MKTKIQTTSTVKRAGFRGHWPLWLAALACCAATQLWAATATIYSNDFEAYYRGGMQDDSLLTGPYADNGRGWLSPGGE